MGTEIEELPLNKPLPLRFFSWIRNSAGDPNNGLENFTCIVSRNQNLELFVLSYQDRDICDDLEFDFEF